MLHYLGIAEISARIRSGHLTSTQATQAMLDRIEQHDARLRSYLCVTADRALRQAEMADADIARGHWRGWLHGVPIAVKDVIDTDFAPTTVGLSFRAGQTPAQSATVVRRLEAAGAVMLGKLATAEGIFIGHHPDYGTPVNPRHPDYWSGVSSSGSGVATAAGLCFGSLGTDTGGSIRVPASIHGLTGLKPSWGRVSRHGLFPLSPTLDHMGPIARNAQDAAILLQAIAGFDADDPTSLDAPVPDYRALVDAPLAGMRIGVDEAFATTDVDGSIVAAFHTALDELRMLGADIVPVTMPPVEDAQAAWAPICGAEAALAHGDDWPRRSAEYGAELAGLLAMASDLTGADVARGFQARQDFSSRFARTIAPVAMIATPTLPRNVPQHGAILAALRDGSTEMGRYTIPSDMTGHPAITLPMGNDDAGHPIGLQLIGQMLDEARLLRVAHQYQRVTDWHCHHPDLS